MRLNSIGSTLAWMLLLANIAVGGAVLGQVPPSQSVGLKPYLEHCAGCHGADPVTLARRSLRKSGEALQTKTGNVLLEAFLASHGAADAQERSQIVALLLAALSDR